MHSPEAAEKEHLHLSVLRQRAILATPPEERFDRLTRPACRLFGTQTSGFAEANKGGEFESA